MSETTLTFLARSHLHAEDIVRMEAHRMGLSVDAKCTMSRFLPSGHNLFSVRVETARDEDLAYLRKWLPQSC